MVLYECPMCFWEEQYNTNIKLFVRPRCEHCQTRMIRSLKQKDIKMKEEFAIIRDPKFGRFNNAVGLSFKTELVDGSMADQFIEGEDLEQLLKDNNIKDINLLKDRVCVVNIDHNHPSFSKVIFVRMG